MSPAAIPRIMVRANHGGAGATQVVDASGGGLVCGAQPTPIARPDDGRLDFESLVPGELAEGELAQPGLEGDASG